MTNPRYIDPVHAVPPYVVDLRNQKEPEEDYYSDQDYFENAPGPEEGIEEGNDTTVSAPTSFDIVGQYVRPQKDGTFLIDVEIEVPDIDGVQDFEIRTAVDT